jgi:hypothetical protein
MRKQVIGVLALVIIATAASGVVAQADGPKRYVLKDDAKFDELCFNSDDKPEETCLSIARLKAAAIVSKDEPTTPFERIQTGKAEVLSQMARLQADLQDCDATRIGYRNQAATGIQNDLSQQIAAIERGLVASHGGDYDKGDRIDWSTKKLIKKKE